MCHGGGTRRDSAPKLSAAGAFLAYRAICRARQSRQAEGFRRLVRAVEQQGATLSLLAAPSMDGNEPAERRTVGACSARKVSGGALLSVATCVVTSRHTWRTSVGSKAKFEHTVILVEKSALQLHEPRPVANTDWRKVRRARRAFEAVDPPTCRYKVAACLYAMAHGGPLKPLADACSLGKSTMWKYLELFADATMKFIKPIYMPCSQGR